MTRRQLLGAGLSLGAFMLPGMPAVWGATRLQRAKATIVILLEGGMSHLDTWDPKPDAPREIRGEFGTIATAVPGLRVGEHLPSLAAQAQRYNIVRSVRGSKEHEQGLHWVLTGFEKPNANTTTFRTNDRHPAQGSVVAYHQLRTGASGEVPPFVAIPNRTQLGGRTQFASAASLGGAYEALETGEPPASAAQPMRLPPSLLLAADLSPERLRDRQALVQRLDELRRAHDREAGGAGMDAHREKAFQLLLGQRMGQVFDLSREPLAVRARYGDHRMGQGALLARRLVEAGVNYVLVNFSTNNSWDTHERNFQVLKERLLPPFDRALSALLIDLDERGLLDEVLVVALGEMGRTPRINAKAGRDHWADASSALLAGGGLTRGQVVGSTTAGGERPRARPVTIADLLLTVYHQLGIQPSTMQFDERDRPIPPLPAGKPVRELIR
jgi:uncharacterized protein (DUF1501 family)